MCHTVGYLPQRDESCLPQLMCGTDVARTGSTVGDLVLCCLCWSHFLLNRRMYTKGTHLDCKLCLLRLLEGPLALRDCV